MGLEKFSRGRWCILARGEELNEIACQRNVAGVNPRVRKNRSHLSEPRGTSARGGTSRCASPKRSTEHPTMPWPSEPIHPRA